MPGRNYYLLAMLPTLGDLGTSPPLTLRELLEHVGSARPLRAIVEALLLSDDLLQRDAFLAGELDGVAPSVLTLAQARNEEPLPPCLGEPPADASAARQAVDTAWGAYFRHADQTARQSGSAFLRAWVAFEVALRNALVVSRAKALNLDAGDYFVAQDLGEDQTDFTPLLNEWASAETPLAGLRVLDRARWRWLDQNGAYFSFSDDELAAYAARLILLKRWRRIAGAEPAEQPR